MCQYADSGGYQVSVFYIFQASSTNFHCSPHVLLTEEQLAHYPLPFFPVFLSSHKY